MCMEMRTRVLGGVVVSALLACNSHSEEVVETFEPAIELDIVSSDTGMDVRNVMLSDFADSDLFTENDDSSSVLECLKGESVVDLDFGVDLNYISETFDVDLNFCMSDHFLVELDENNISMSNVYQITSWFDLMGGKYPFLKTTCANKLM